MNKAIVIINEQHELMDEQRQMLDTEYDSWEFCKVPASGWTLEEQEKLAGELQEAFREIVFASPVPYLMLACSTRLGRTIEAQYWGKNHPVTSSVVLFHNDLREKKELPGGKIIHVASQTGWQLVWI